MGSRDFDIVVQRVQADGNNRVAVPSQVYLLWWNDTLMVLLQLCKMEKTCVVPECKSGYKNVDMTSITMHSFREEWKGKIQVHELENGR